MTLQVMVVAPHPDDETLGCGGALLRHVAAGDSIHWVVMTEMKEEYGYAREQVARRSREIEAVARSFGFTSWHSLGYRPAALDRESMAGLIQSLAAVVTRVAPHTIYLPFRGDAHSDHRVTFDAAVACTKWFRYPSVRRALSYEALSETDFGMDPGIGGFNPNCFVDISPFLDRKLEIASMYEGEFREPPFPRSASTLRALAQVRGAAAGCLAAEGFVLLKEIIAS